MNSNKEQERREQAKDFSSLFEEFRADITSYTNKRLNYIKLTALERLSQTSALLAVGLITTFLAFCLFGFGLIALSFYLGEALHSNAAGFGAVALFWLILLILVLVFYKPLKNFFLNRTIRILYNLEREEEDDEQK